MKVKIFKPTKSAMQSGRKNTKKWLLVPLEEKNTRSNGNIMKWVSSNDTRTQLKFEFNTRDEAIKYATSQGFAFELEEPQVATVKKKSYAANFTGA